MKTLFSFANLQRSYWSSVVKFGYSEKATQFEKIFHLKFDVTESNFKWKIFSNFVAFSEYPNLSCLLLLAIQPKINNGNWQNQLKSYKY